MTDDSVVASLSVAAAAACSPPSFDDTGASFSVTESMVSFLRMEANHADDRAKRLRKQAAEIAEQFGITEESQQSYDLDPTELPPLDEKGLPKYKGKKRGRKPKEKKRKSKPDRPKRKHTGYTLYMQEIYPAAKSEYPDYPSKELISLVARRWKGLEIEGRTAWKERARGATEDREITGGRTTSTNSSGNEDRIDAATSCTKYSYLTSKDMDIMRDKHKDDDNDAGRGTLSNPHQEGNGENEDEDIDGDLSEE